ncbi:unnamed protein product [Caenorhabditis brenneri]
MFMLLIFLLVSVPESTALDKMMKVFGRVSTVEYTSPSDVTPECVKLCYNTEECILAYLDAEGSCQNYRYKLDNVTLSVLETSEDEGHTVAFKTTLPDSTCPAYENLRFSKVANDGTSYSWRKTLDGWKFERCATGSMQSERNGVTLLQILSVAFFEEDLKINPDARSGTRGFFIDGMRNCPDGISCTNFVWSDGLTNGSALFSSSNAMIRNTTSTANDNNCLAVVYSSATSSCIIVDVSCDTMDMIGVTCGYELE